MAKRYCKGSDAGYCRCFPGQAGFEFAPSDGGIQDGGDQQDAYVPSEDQNGDRDRDQILVGQHKEKSAQEEFVCNRIKIRTKYGTLLEPSRQGAVERITQPSRNKKDETERKPIIEDRRHQEGRQAYPHERQQVRSGMERIQACVQTIRHGQVRSDASLPIQPSKTTAGFETVTTVSPKISAVGGKKIRAS